MRGSGLRWPVETASEEAKGEVGMDHYEVRTWRGWHHRVTQIWRTTALVHYQRTYNYAAYCSHRKRTLTQTKQTRSPPKKHKSRCRVLIVSREGIKFSGSVGFRNGSASVHTSRTMMLTELRILLDHVAAGAAAGDYTESIIDENILGKPTRAARQKTARRLRELYGVDPHYTLFRLLRHFWTADTNSQPMLAFLVAAARDPLLRETTPIVQEIPFGQSVSSNEIAKRLAEKYPQRFSPTTQLSTAQNLASSWSQAGYLKGRAKKIRTRPYVTPVVVAFTLLIGYLCGLRGSLLLDCVWTRLLDRSSSELTDLVTEASKQGWLSFKASGSVLEISFPGLLTPAEEKPAYESH